MDLGSIFLVLALSILVLFFISRPFFEQKTVPASMIVDQEEHEISYLLAERDQVLDALQELDFDYALGKIPERDYPAQRKALLDRGANVLRELDSHGTANGAVQDKHLDEIDVRLEAAIAARQADIPGENASIPGTEAKVVLAATAIADPDDDLEVMIANRRRNRNDKSAGFCPKCGGPVQKSDLFCPKCGATMA
jgi:hypothetical protein